MSNHARTELKNGSTLTLAASDDLELRRVADGGPAEKLLIPWPRRGFAGGSFFLSESEEMAVLSMYSGQSEEGYELLGLSPLRRISTSPYVFGYLSSFAFSHDESVLAVALLQDCTEWWTRWEDEMEDFGGTSDDSFVSKDRVDFPVGSLRLHDISSDTVQSCHLHVRVSQKWRPTPCDVELALIPSFDGDSVLLEAPWGRTRVPRPLPAEWVSDFPCEG
jgi:hypothetical protein